MKKKNIFLMALLALTVLLCVGCGKKDPKPTETTAHTHTFGQWQTQNAATCESPEIQVRKCPCGQVEKREGDPATGHQLASVAVESLLKSPKENTTVTVEDLRVTGTCKCGAAMEITEQIQLENSTLAAGENTVTVKCGEFSAQVRIVAEHDYKVIAAKEPTCTENGNYKYYKCDICSKYFDSSKKETTKEAQMIPGGHSFGTLVAKKEATCTEDGMKEHYRCTVCNKYFLEKDGQKVATPLEDLKISAGHDYKLIAAKEPTCTKDGNYKYYKCDDCGKYFDADKKETTKEAQTISAGHTFGALVAKKEATCTEDGMKEHYRCTVCEKYFVEKDGEKVAVSAESLKISADHDYKLIAAKEPTCTKDGNYKYYKCSVCEKYFDADKKETTKEAQKIPALGHQEETLPGKTATCTEAGLTEGSKCTVCGEVTVPQEEIPAAHTYKVIAAKEPTCTKDGNYKYYKCSVCEKYFDADKKETTKEAQKIPALGHDEVEHEAKAPTCTEIGWEAYVTCTRCEYTTYEEKTALGHSCVVAQNDKAATCESSGWNKFYKCTAEGCGKYFTDKAGTNETTKEAQKIPALGHDEVEHEAKAPTCTEIGWEAYVTCSKCDYTTYEEKAALGHTFDDLIPQVDATCTETGTKAHYHCSVCNKDYMVKNDGTVSATPGGLTINAKGHDEVSHEAKAPTCTEIGWDAYVTCSKCDYTTYEEKAALGHTFGDLIPQVDATCTDTGTKAHYHCSVCNKNYMRKNDGTIATQPGNLTIAVKSHKDTNGDGECDTCNEACTSSGE